jgi:hypothetical protein
MLPDVFVVAYHNISEDKAGISPATKQSNIPKTNMRRAAFTPKRLKISL